MTAPLDFADIQGDILRAYGNAYDCTTYVFAHIDAPPEQGRAWLGGLVDRVTTAQLWTRGKPATTLNLAVTAAGLAALGVAPAVVDSFAIEFRHGMAARATLLGDAGPSAPSAWEEGLDDRTVHVLLVVNAQTPALLADALDELRGGIAHAGGVTIVAEQHARLLAGAREHFGFADGFAQPAIAGASEEKARGGGVPLKHGGWRALATGEFVLGYPDEDTLSDRRRRLPAAPADPLGRSGTYMVWRKLHQDVALWRRTLRAAAARYHDGDEHKLAAKVVGRWQDGAPLATHPGAPDPAFDAAAPRANDFRYGDDPDGRRCPIGAHIRRSNPRDALGHDGTLSMRHRMIRRGMPYGSPLADGALEDDGAERGLIFVSFQASIARQFEGIQGPWLSDGNIFGLGHDGDFLLGNAAGAGKMTIQGQRPFFLAPQQPLVTTRGGGYLFVPGITALGALADGTAG
jgi:Dyp-type peroxidase family